MDGSESSLYTFFIILSRLLWTHLFSTLRIIYPPPSWRSSILNSLIDLPLRCLSLSCPIFLSQIRPFCGPLSLFAFAIKLSGTNQILFHDIIPRNWLLTIKSLTLDFLIITRFSRFIFLITLLPYLETVGSKTRSE